MSAIDSAADDSTEMKDAVDELERLASVEGIKETRYDDIIVVEFNSSSFRPGNIKCHLPMWEVTHVDFEERAVELTKIN